MDQIVDKKSEVVGGVKEISAQEKLKRGHDKEAALGRGFFRLAASRQEQRLTAYLDTGKYPKDLLAKIGEVSKETDLTSKMMEEARQASFGIALESAAQISEVQLPRAGGMREDINSLGTLVASVRGGEKLGKELLDSKQIKLVADLARETMARRLGKPSAEIQMPDAQALAWAQEQFTKANARLGRGYEALKAYLS